VPHGKFAVVAAVSVAAAVVSVGVAAEGWKKRKHWKKRAVLLGDDSLECAKGGEKTEDEEWDDVGFGHCCYCHRRRWNRSNFAPSSERFVGWISS